VKDDKRERAVAADNNGQKIQFNRERNYDTERNNEMQQITFTKLHSHSLQPTPYVVSGSPLPMNPRPSVSQQYKQSTYIMNN